MLVVAIIAMQMPRSGVNPQWHDRYEIRIGGARLGMSQAEFEVAKQKQPILARIETEFDSGHLMYMRIRDYIPNSNIPVPGDLIADLDHPGSPFGRGIVNGLMFGPEGATYFPKRDTIHSMWLYVDDRKNWGATLFEDRSSRSNSREFKGEVKNHRSVSIDVQVALSTSGFNTISLPGEQALDGHVFARTTVRNIKPGQKARFKLSTNQPNPGQLRIESITER